MWRRNSSSKSELVKYAAALAAVYVVWGSTYLAIRVVVADIPPLLAAGIRFVIAGLLLYGWSILRGSAAPNGREWRNLATVGSLMFFGCYSLLFWAEKTMPSGLASVLVATLPLWTLMLEISFLRTQKLTPILLVGLGLGFAGVLVVSLASGAGINAAQWRPTVAVLLGEIAWAGGSILSKRLQLPATQSVNAGGQMLTGGAMLLAVSPLMGEWRSVVAPRPVAVFGLLYLIVAGSLAAFSAYVWLLERMGPTRVSSYAYVNPVIALLLGYFLGGEHFPSGAILGSVLVLASVVLILTRRDATRPARSVTEIAEEAEEIEPEYAGQTRG